MTIPIQSSSAASQETRSTCCYCGVGCGVIIESQAGQITGVRGDPHHPANHGRLCSKGSTLHLTAAAHVQMQTRLLHPLFRKERGAALQPLDWGTALDTLATRLSATREEHGPDAIGIYVSGQLLTEDYYVFNKLAKGVLGTNNIDSNSRLCMSSAVAGYKSTLGADAPPACYEDIAHADTIVIAGSNLANAHPILMRRLEDVRNARPEQKLIVVDPRVSETAALADLHLQLLPGTDIALFNGLLHVLLWDGQVDTAFINEHTEGFAPLRERVRDCTPRETARITGLCQEDILCAAKWWGQSKSVLSLYCQGLNQSSSGTANNAALINLHLATGQIGRPGAGPLSLTGQPNAMGGREVGGMANLLSAHRDLASAQDRAEVAQFWGIPQVPARPGKTAVEMFEAAADGAIKLLWIVCTNPAHSMPNQNLVRAALQRAEYVVLQEAYANTATATYADLLLPAATWGEKEGTVTNSERRISRVRAAVLPVGQAKPDWQIAVDVAHRLGAAKLMPYTTPEQIWLEHRNSTRGRDLDITGMSWPMLDKAGPQQWPMPNGATSGRARLYTDGVFATPNGKAQFVDTAHQGVAEPRDARYPFSLNTGRLRDQWHGMSRTGNLGRLYGQTNEPQVLMHAQDMARLGIADGQLARLSTRRGEQILVANASATVAAMQVFAPMHWDINVLTLPTYCPKSKQPELKHSAVHIEPANLSWNLSALAWLPAHCALSVRHKLQELCKPLVYASCVPFGHEPDALGRLGLQLRLAHHEPAGAEVIDAIRTALGLSGTGLLQYQDRQRGQQRVLRIEQNHLLAFCLSGQFDDQEQLRSLLLSKQELQGNGRTLLLPGATPTQPRSPQICTCLNVSQAQIETVLPRISGTAAQRLAGLQGALGCGTQCGSCVPQLKLLIQTSPMAKH